MTERVREDASGDSEGGEEDDDELPRVIGERAETVYDEAREDQWGFRSKEWCSIPKRATSDFQRGPGR